jgi:hypothetical protein
MISRLLLFLALALPALAVVPERLASIAALSADFTETRHTPLKKRPVVVAGTVRIDREHGLSLAYDQPRAPLVILDAQGLLLRHPDGREQPAPPDAEQDIRLLHALFAFDFATLEKSYERRTAENPDDTWTLTFTRRAESTASYRELVLTGNADHLTAITLAKTSNLRTEITLSAPRVLAAFPPEDLARYFR